MRTLPTGSVDPNFGRCVFFNDTATTEIYTLSLHDALPIYAVDLPLVGRAHGREQHAVARGQVDRKSTRLNSSHANISYAVFCLKKKTVHYIGVLPNDSVEPIYGMRVCHRRHLTSLRTNGPY